MVRTQIQLTEEQARMLKVLAVGRGVSIAELIRQSLTLLLHSSASVSPEERRKRALEVAGRFRSGKPDVSVKHDVHLAEAYRK